MASLSNYWEMLLRLDGVEAIKTLVDGKNTFDINNPLHRYLVGKTARKLNCIANSTESKEIVSNYLDQFGLKTNKNCFEEYTRIIQRIRYGSPIILSERLNNNNLIKMLFRKAAKRQGIFIKKFIKILGVFAKVKIGSISRCYKLTSERKSKLHKMVLI